MRLQDTNSLAYRPFESNSCSARGNVKNGHFKAILCDERNMPKIDVYLLLVEQSPFQIPCKKKRRLPETASYDLVPN